MESLEKLKLKEVSALLKETPGVLRNWLRDYKGLIPIEKADNGFNLFGPEAIAKLRTIQQMHRQQGYSTRQIEHYLRTGEEVAAAVQSVEMVPDAPQALEEIKEQLRQLTERQDDLARQQLEIQRETLRRLNERNEMLTLLLEQRREEREKAQRPWWKFWGRE
ncbi:MerR family transcriptional regulator [Paenibacillus sp. GCM10027626]|uniref:MerR family transcriptional regulator n=1 Tax=Paenibacillus sp. GCM10027626 TaxID=3273411 RepID=UPI0036444510